MHRIALRAEALLALSTLLAASAGASVAPPQLPPSLQLLLNVSGAPDASAPDAGRTKSAPLSYAERSRQNAAAAARFEAQHRGPRNSNPQELDEAYPDAHGVGFESTRNITPLSFNQRPIYRIEDIVRDFRANHTAAQRGILVVLKTEYCCTNVYRPCAVTTAALENSSPPDLARFKIYGAWIKNEEHARPDLFSEGTMRQVRAAFPGGATLDQLQSRFPQQAGWLRWSGQLEDYYSFNQGPGANLFFINPNTDLNDLRQHPIRDMEDAVRRGIVVRTDAVQVGYYYNDQGEVDWKNGMQRQLDQVAQAFRLGQGGGAAR